MTHPIETRYLARMRETKDTTVEVWSSQFERMDVTKDTTVEVWSSQFERRPKSWYRVSPHGNFHDPFGWRTVFTRPPGFLSQEEALQDLAAKAEKSKLIAAENAERAAMFCSAVGFCIRANRVTLVTPTEDSKP